MSASIVASKLTKYYGHEKVAAVRDLDISVNSGEIYGFLGSNGAGKSTTIRLLLNFLRPSHGSVKILGLDSVSGSVAIKRHVGYLAGDVALYQKANGRQFLDYMSRLLPATTFRQELAKRFEADLDKPIATLSKGNRQKLGIIQAFMHEPSVLILDEPTSGLDPLMQEAFYQTLEESKQRGAAIFMSSHNLGEAQRVCDRIGIIKTGKLIHEQAINDRSDLSATTYKVTFATPAELAECIRSNKLKLLSSDNHLTASFQATTSIKEALTELSNYNLKAIDTIKLDLEDEFLEFYGSER